jgi:sulfur carrier protein
LELIDELKIGEKTIAVAVNMDVIKKDIWCKYVLKEGDKIELIQFVGGG